jgi:hypothetical protein
VKHHFLDRPRRLYLICVLYETSPDRIDQLKFEKPRKKPYTFYTTVTTLKQAREAVAHYKDVGVRAGGGTFVLETKIIRFVEKSS